MKIVPHPKHYILFFSVILAGLSVALIAGYKETLFPDWSSRETTGYRVNPDTLKTQRSNTPDTLFTYFLRSAEAGIQGKNYRQALTDLEKAQKLKPNDPALKEKISQVKGLINDQDRMNAEYQKAIASGDTYFNAKNYLDAKAFYQVAIDNKPEDSVAKSKLRKTMELLRSQKAQNILYDVAVASADKLFQEKDYDHARQEYENASKLLPGEAYPKNRINEIIKMQTDKQVNDELYAKAIENGDKLYQTKSFQSALLEYQKAQTLKPDESYPKEKIAELTSLIAAQKAKDDAYNKAITLADLLFQQTQYTESIKGYQQALTIKPEQLYPKNRIREIEGILARMKRVQEDYERYITLADSLYILKNYIGARDNYLLASSVKPGEAYPKEMASKSDKMLTGQSAEMARSLDEQYTGLVIRADKLMADKLYQQARAEYVKASNIKPLELHPKSMIQEIDKVLSDQKALEDQYNLLISNADKLVAQKSYEQAKGEYRKALGLKPDEKYPQQRISEIDGILNELLTAKNREEQYKSLIASGDRLITEKSYQQAKTEYQNALAIKPGEAYPKSRIDEIDRILKELSERQATDERYAGSIHKADSLLALKSYDPAKIEYQNALKIKPAESYPKSKLSEIDQVLAALAKDKALQDQYSTLISTAESQLAGKEYTSARSTFAQALQLKADDPYAKGKIAEIDTILSELAAKKAQDEKYQGILANADKLLASKSLESARAEYVNASALKPAEQYPKDKIAEIDRSLGDIAAKKAMDEQYAKILSGADLSFSEKVYDQAKTAYQNAFSLKPSESYPKSRITEIDTIFAVRARQQLAEEKYQTVILNGDKLLADKSWDPAKLQFQEALKIKPSEQYPKDKIAEADKALGEIAKQKALDEQYAAIIVRADKLLGDKSWELARNEYSNALNLKSTDPYPKNRIAEIDKTLAEIAGQKALDERYLGIITNADKLLSAKTYDQARAEYSNASNLKPAEQYPKNKIAEIDKTLADLAAQKALDEKYSATIVKADKLLTAKNYEQARTEYVNADGLKPNETYPKTKITEIDQILANLAKQKALDEEYTSLLVDADKLFAEKSFEQAKTGYQKASELKPAEQYPKTKLAETEKALNELARLKAIDEQYTLGIGNADKLLAEKNYDQARAAYLDAAKIKPNEQYPRDKVTEIATILAEIARQKNVDDQYKATIARADQFFTAKSFDQSKTEYTNALKIKPEEQYPRDKIADIDAILAELKAKEESYKATVVKADQLLAEKKYEDSRTEYQNALAIKPEARYPNDKILEINKILTELKGKKQTYDELVADADGQLKNQEWLKAKGLYQQALTVFPEESYPKERITLIASKVDSIFRANKGKYDKAVADGDRFYNGFEYDKAIDAYSEASNFLPTENYPKEMVAKIRKIIAENAIVDILKTPVTIGADEEKQFSFAPVSMASRKNNFVYIKIKNLTEKPLNVLLRYGKDSQRGGGVVIRNLSANGKLNERLISVRDQDAWYRIDNNWISLYPQGGAVEVSFIQVSRAQ